MSGRAIAVRLALAASLALGCPCGAGSAESPVPVVRDQVGDAPWYDANTDSWRRIDLPRDDDERRYDSGEGGDGVPGFAYLMYALVALAIVLIAVQLWRLRGTGRAAAAGAGVQVPVRLSALPFALPEGDGDPEAAFAAACAAGEWTRAVVWLYAWQLLRLDLIGVVRLLPGKTNRGYLREAAVLPAAGAALAATVAVFERSYFGHVPASRGEVEELAERHRALLGALPAGREDA
jgi:hypothetical protein